MTGRLRSALSVLLHGEQPPPKGLAWDWVDLPPTGWNTLVLLLPPSVPSEQMPLFAEHVTQKLSGPGPRVVALPAGSSLAFKRETEPKKE